MADRKKTEERNSLYIDHLASIMKIKNNRNDDVYFIEVAQMNGSGIFKISAWMQPQYKVLVLGNEHRSVFFNTKTLKRFIDDNQDRIKLYHHGCTKGLSLSLNEVSKIASLIV